MPHTIGEFALTTIGLALVGAFSYLATRWWGADEETDVLVALWRRWGALGRPQVATVRPRARKPKTVIDVKRPPRARTAKPARAKVTKAQSDRDHVPLGSSEAAASDEPTEPKLSFRRRFRRGLRKTRERLGEGMRESFARGATPEAFDELEEALVAADVGVATATAIVDDLRKQAEDLRADKVRDTLKDAMLEHLKDADRRLRLVRGHLTVWVVAGVNGTGKTTSIAKLAARATSLGLKVSLAAADTFRAAGIEQLAEWGKRLGVDVIRQKQGADPGAVAFDAIAHARSEKKDLVIIDTAGRLHTRKPLMDELTKIMRVIERESDAAVAECLLVVDATTGQNGISQAKAFKEAVGVTGLVLAKLDGTAKGGIVFAVERELGVPVKAVGVGEHQNDLVPFDPNSFVDALIGDARDEK